MLFKFLKASDVKSSEITPESMYHNRRDFIQNSLKVGVGMTAIGAGLGTGLGGINLAQASAEDAGLGQPLENIVKGGLYNTDEKSTSYGNITSYNNFYEFGTGKLDPARYAASLKPAPWTVKVDGHVEKPGDYAIEDLIKPHKLQERIYRMRCVEAWSMVIPWVGIPLADMINALRPTSAAKYVVFETLVDPKQMPGQNRQVLYWPYVEGLRMDEAMNPLTLMAVGLYDAKLPNQNGAPMRLVVPWKYGFKGIKSIVRMSFVETQPNNSWRRLASNEYGFYANVNPLVDHPRWSQASERRIGEFRRRETLMFNGYSEEVASMYSGLDLKKNF